jgi:hypothetical protein
MLTLARLRTDAACDSLRVADATRYSYITSDISKMHVASADFCILTAALGKSWDFRLNGKLPIAHTSINQP